MAKCQNCLALFAQISLESVANVQNGAVLSGGRGEGVAAATFL